MNMEDLKIVEKPIIGSRKATLREFRGNASLCNVRWIAIPYSRPQCKNYIFYVSRHMTSKPWCRNMKLDLYSFDVLIERAFKACLMMFFGITPSTELCCHHFKLKLITNKDL